MAGNQPEQICSNTSCCRLVPSCLEAGGQGMDGSIRCRLYRPLDKAIDNIRLIRIKRGGRGELVRCTLFTTPLFKSPSPKCQSQYELGFTVNVRGATAKEHIQSGSHFVWRALSHVWGSAKKTKAILINGERIVVRPYLYEALVWLRYHGFYDAVWIDALCIDQTNPIEKEQQIQIMGKIYSSAAETLIYVPMIPGREIEPEYVREDTRISEILRRAECLPDGLKGEGSATSELEHDPEELLTWAAGGFVGTRILNMLSLIVPDRDVDNYWTRRWTAQEMILAQSLTLISGALRIPWAYLQETCENCRQISFIIATSNEEDAGLPRVSLSLLGDTRALSRNVLRNPKLRSSLLYLLILMASDDCTDPRDKIYGLLGLVDQCDVSDDLRIQPNYTLCVQCVWYNATIFMIFKTNRLDVLGVCGLAHPSQYPTTISWVPDYTNISRRSYIWETYSLSERTVPVMQLDTQYCLRADGFIIGAARTEHCLIHIETTSLIQSIVRELMEIKRFLLRNTSGKHHLEKFSEDFSAIIPMNSGAEEEGYPISTILKNDIEKIWNERRPTVRNLSGTSRRYLTRMFAILQDQRLLVINPDTEQPLVAFYNFYPEMNGDLICAVLGCNAPLVVRRNQDGDRIVGQCFIPRYADGKAMKNLAESKRTFQTFTFV